MTRPLLLRVLDERILQMARRIEALSRLKAAELCYRATYPKFEGLTACLPPSDWQRVVQQKDELVAALRQGKYVDVMKAGRADLPEGCRPALLLRGVT